MNKEEKEKFLDLYNVCKEGRKRFMDFEGNEMDYFLNHQMGASDASWCIKKGYIACQKVCELAVSWNGLIIQYLTGKQRTPKVCELAVTQNGLAIQYLTWKQRTPKICRLAVTENGLAIQYLSEIQRTPKICRLAVSNNAKAIQYLTELQKIILAKK